MMANTPKLFTKEDLLPKTGNPFPAESTAAFVNESAIIDGYDEIFVSNPRHYPVFAKIDQLRLLGLAQPGKRKRALRVLAPSGSGKTTIILKYAEKLEARLPEEDKGRCRPVVVLSVHPKIKVRGWWVAVLTELGDELISASDTEEVLRRRAYTQIANHGVELLVIDEVQHLAVGSKMTDEVTDRLKRFLDDGIVPLVLVGTSEAKDMLQSNVQLSNRMMPPADIEPYTTSKQDRKDFAGFLQRLDRAIVAKNLMPKTAGLGDGLIPACIMEVSGGRLGMAVNLVRVALGRACRREAEMIELCDLQSATETWAVDQAIILKNPFFAEVGG